MSLDKSLLIDTHSSGSDTGMDGSHNRNQNVHYTTHECMYVIVITCLYSPDRHVITVLQPGYDYFPEKFGGRN